MGYFSKSADNKIQKNNAERWDMVAEMLEEQRGFIPNAARAASSIECWRQAPARAVRTAIKSAFWNDPIGKFTKAVMEGNVEAIETAMLFWVDFSADSVDVGANTQGVKNIVMGLAGFALISSFIVGGWRIASSRRGGLQEGSSELNDNMLRWLVFSIAVPAMFPGALVASDMLAAAIMDQFGGADELINLGGLEDSVFGPVVMLALSGVMFAGSMVQILALVTRVLIAPIAAGLTPLFAALSFSETGRQGLNHLVAFLIAAIAFKPLSALLYAVVLWNVSEQGDIGFAGGVINALMVGIAGFSAPALVRALVPAVAQAGGGSTAPMLAGAAGAIALGAGVAGAALNRAGSGLVNATSKGKGEGNSSAGTGAQIISGGGSGTARGAASRAGSGTTEKSTAKAQGGSRLRRSIRGTARGVGRVAQGASLASRGLAFTAQNVRSVAHQPQHLFDDSIGVSGPYQGQARR